MGEGVLLLIEMALLAASAGFSGSETALFSLEEDEIEELGRGPGGARVLRLLEDRRRLLVTILLGNLFVNILYINFGVVLQQQVGGALGLAVPFAVLGGLILAGEIVPKTMAFRHRRTVARLASVPLEGLARLTWPLRVVLSAVARVVARLVMGTRPEEGALSPAELDRMVELAQEEGTLREREAAWLQALLDLGEIKVKQVLVPRVAIIAFDLNQGREDFLDLLRQHRRNKVPVHHGDLDEIEGYLDAKEVLANPDTALEELVRPLSFIPETTDAATVLEKLLVEPSRMLLVVDEYGGTEGLVTRENVIEAVLGDLADEEEEARAPLVRLDEGVWEVEALLGVGALERLVGSLPLPGGAHTVGGVVSAELGRLPEVGDRVRIGPLELEVTEMEPTRVRRLRLRSLERREGR